MRTLTLIGVLILTMALAGPALAESGPRGDGVAPAVQGTGTQVSLPYAAHLQLSPLFIEILAIEERARATERFLLRELNGTTDAAEAARIVRSLERLDADKRLEILETRMVHARRTGHYDLALRLRSEIVEIMTRELQATR